MRKLLVILLVTFYSSISIANIDHYNKYNKIELEIFRNDERGSFIYDVLSPSQLISISMAIPMAFPSLQVTELFLWLFL